jgi:hypothetical protein
MNLSTIGGSNLCTYQHISGVPTTLTYSLMTVPSVRGFNFLKLAHFVFHNTDPLLVFRFIRYNKLNKKVVALVHVSGRVYPLSQKYVAYCVVCVVLQ